MREIPGGTRGRQGSAQLTCPNTDADHSDQSVPVLFAPPFLEGRDRADDAIAGDVGSSLEADDRRARQRSEYAVSSQPVVGVGAAADIEQGLDGANLFAAASVPLCHDQLVPGGLPDHLVDDEPIDRLEQADRLPGLRAEDAVRGDGEARAGGLVGPIEQETCHQPQTSLIALVRQGKGTPDAKQQVRTRLTRPAPSGDEIIEAEISASSGWSSSPLTNQSINPADFRRR